MKEPLALSHSIQLERIERELIDVKRRLDRLEAKKSTTKEKRTGKSS